MKTSFCTIISLFLIHLNVLYSQSHKCGLILACQKARPHPKCEEVPIKVPPQCIKTTTARPSSRTTTSGPTRPWSPSTTGKEISSIIFHIYHIYILWLAIFYEKPNLV